VKFRGRLARLERELPPTSAAECEERERDREFGELVRWMFSQHCTTASELIAAGLTVPERFTRCGMEDLLTAERAYHAMLLGTRLFYHEDERYVRQELDELVRLGVDEATAREWASRFEFKELE
jgi:hypothetical protein